jgi:hypothetical protein
MEWWDESQTLGLTSCKRWGDILGCGRYDGWDENGGFEYMEYIAS